ncbi:MAG: DUF4491 family protein [Bacteroidales bacterium]|nr:DUF4491 family protein [Bacteroidales bacterium]
MNYSGILVGAAVFFCIGICHPAVIKMEYYLGKKTFSCFWGILEMHQQEKRVLRGWFPENPKRHAYYETLRQKKGS